MEGIFASKLCHILPCIGEWFVIKSIPQQYVLLVRIVTGMLIVYKALFPNSMHTLLRADQFHP